MTKQLLIDNAYLKRLGIGLYLDNKKFVDENGWLHLLDVNNKDLKTAVEELLESFQQNGSKVRPKELKGLEDNYGWTKVDSDGSNLPIDKGEYWIINRWGHLTKFVVSHPDTLYDDWMLHQFTHFQPILQPKHPMY